MTAPLDIKYFIGQIEKLYDWVQAIPNTDEYRNTTTVGEFRSLYESKKMELGLTPEVITQLDDFKDDQDLAQAWMEVSMTMDHQDLVHSAYLVDLPLNYYWMPEYEGVQKAVKDFMGARPSFESGDEENQVLLEVVRKHLAEFPVAPK